MLPDASVNASQALAFAFAFHLCRTPEDRLGNLSMPPFAESRAASSLGIEDVHVHVGVQQNLTLLDAALHGLPPRLRTPGVTGHRSLGRSVMAEYVE